MGKVVPNWESEKLGPDGSVMEGLTCQRYEQ